MNQIITIGGKPFLDPSGTVILTYDPAAPNSINLGETVTIRNAIDETQYITFELPAGDYSSYSRINIIFKATTLDGIRVSAPFSIKNPVAGSITLGNINNVLGDIANIGNFQYQISAVDTSNRIGVATNIQNVSLDTDVIFTIPEILSFGISGSGIVGDLHTANWSVSGSPDPSITIQWYRGATPISGATNSTYTPVSADDGTILTCVLTAINTEGTAQSTSSGINIIEQFAPIITSATITGNGRNGTLHAVTYTTSNVGVPVATVSYQWKLGGVDISGATSSSYTPNTDGNLTCVVTLTNIKGSSNITSNTVAITTGTTNVAPTVVSASITGTTAAGSTHSLSVVATGTPTPTLSYVWKLNGGTVTGATSSTYVSPANSTAELTCTVTATNSQGSDSKTTAVVVLVPVQPLALGQTDWEFVTSNDVDGQVKLETIKVKVNRLGQSVQATTSSQTSDSLAVFEDLTLVNTDVTWQYWRVNNWDGSGTTRDFRIFDPTTYPSDEARAGRLAVRFKTSSDVWSPRSSVKQITLDYPNSNPNELFTYGEFIPLHHRSKEQYIGNGTTTNPQPGPAGNGHQFWRSYANSPDDPDFIICGMDVSIPMMTRDFAGWWEHPDLIGLKSGRSVQSIALDSEDSNRVILLYGNASLRGSAGNLNGWDDYSGLYLSTNRGDSCTLTKNIPSLGGSNANQSGETVTRYMQHCIVEVPGGTPTTREWWCVAHQMPLGSATTNIQVLKSTNGGTTWSLETNLSASTYDMPTVLKRAANGHWWMGTKNGLYKSTTNPAGTWTKITNADTGIANGFISEIDVLGATNEVWVSVRGNGLWKTTNGGTAASSWTRVYNYNIETFVISPHDRDIILVAGDNGASPRVLPKRTTNGRAATPTWTTIVTNAYPGQANDFESFIQSDEAYFIWHKTDPNKVFAARFQHHGLSTDGGVTFNWASANFDYNYVYGTNMDPADWTKMLKAMTDRIIMLGVDCDNYVLENTDNTINDTFKNTIRSTLGTNGYIGSGRGALTLHNGSNTIYVSGLGDNNNRVPYYLKKASDNNPLSAATLLTYYGSQGCNNGSNTPGDNSVGYIGRNRITLNSNGTVSQKDMGKECIGMDSGGNLYAVGGKVIYKCTNPTTTGTPTWSTYATMAYNSDINRISCDPSKANGKFLCGNASGRFELVDNGASRVVANVSTILGAGWPGYLSYSCALDPTSTAAYIVFYIYGGGGVWKTTNIDATTPTWTNIATKHFPACPNHVFVHRTTGDLFSCSNSGNFIYPAHVKQTNSYYDRVWDTLSKYQL